MLKEYQAAQLLLRCEEIAGKKLAMTRGNLGKAESRAAAVWELLTFEAASEFGRVEYEVYPGGSPDIHLHFSQVRSVWIEVAFLYPRFWEKERTSNIVAAWIFEEAGRRGIASYKITYHFSGDRNHKAGPVRKLPGLHEKKSFLNGSGVNGFFDKICADKTKKQSITLPGFSLSLAYSPDAQGPTLSGGGLVQESPRTIKEHGVYRVLKAKAKQHKVEGPRIICIGSDQSPVLSILRSPWSPSVQDAVHQAFRENHSLSAALIVRIESSYEMGAGIVRRAVFDLFANPYAKEPLTDEEIKTIKKMNFNRWKYTYPLEKYEYDDNKTHTQLGGALSVKEGKAGAVIEIPADIIVDSLMGRTNLLKEYDMSEDNALVQKLNEGWTVSACDFIPGNIEAGESPKISLSFTPSPCKVYWPGKGST